MIWTFWLNLVSPHLSATIRALASMPGNEVTVVAESEMTADRMAIGWSVPDCSPARILVCPSDAQIAKLTSGARANYTVHLFGGMTVGTLNRKVIGRCAATGATIGLLSETADNRGFLGVVRKARYHVDRLLAGRKVDFILAMGTLGVRWFESSGYESSRIFPFAYVTERPSTSCENITVEGPFRILYLGRIIRLKDGATAIRALAGLDNCDWTLDIVGDGADRHRWHKIAEQSGVSDQIHFHPPIDNCAIGKLFDRSDLLLLPSRKDGWGAVVNEALMCGVPVVCSDNCGAADLLRDKWRGSVFETGSAESLRAVLRLWIEQGRPDEQFRARIRNWSVAIEGPTLAQYLIDVVDCVRDGRQRPCPPWHLGDGNDLRDDLRLVAPTTSD